jgi:hypothetical protein
VGWESGSLREGDLLKAITAGQIAERGMTRHDDSFSGTVAEPPIPGIHIAEAAFERGRVRR